MKLEASLAFPISSKKPIRNYAAIAKPLTSILKGLEKRTSNTPIALSEDQQRTLEIMKSAFTTAPVLVYFLQGLTIFVETDASFSGLGACLSQDQDVKRHVIEYASRTLKDAETRYHSNEIECAAVHWAFTETFRLHLLGHKFQLITVNYTAAYVISKSGISRKFARYLSKETYSHTQELHKYSPTTDDVRDITCWRCGVKGHASFTCNLPPPQRCSHIAPLRNTSRHSEDSNNQRNTPYSQSRNITEDCNSSPCGSTGSNSAHSRGSSSRVSTTRPVSTRENESPTINCIKTNTNKRAIIPTIINETTEIQALCDPCSDIAVILQSCLPADSVINP
ncbi:hypothetical protein AVEN_58119-1 [Araneus ventricosus]|uniref:Reverse transcriptase/retrotransposon-derived protein RNase H-like domain-containing protein n=1 Tax=Araneus ventricosus TaxID=182803 RepID=A0A4Y2L0Y5_ARAVE|nr:hypothetical protein AVEN_58119-1 [Araneus ventricosus]